MFSAKDLKKLVTETTKTTTTLFMLETKILSAFYFGCFVIFFAKMVSSVISNLYNLIQFSNIFYLLV